MERITSLSNNRIKEAALWSAKARERRKADVYLVEGRKMFLEAPEAELQEIFVADSLWERLETEEGAELDAQLKKRLRELDAEGLLPVFLVTDEVLRKIADTQTPRELCVSSNKSIIHWSSLLQRKTAPCSIGRSAGSREISERFCEPEKGRVSPA